MKITTEKGVCPKCNGYKVIDNDNNIGYNKLLPSESTCLLCNGEGLIVVRTVEEEEIENTPEKKLPPPPKDRKFKEGAIPPKPNS